MPRRQHQVKHADLPGAIYQHIMLTLPQDHGTGNAPLQGIEGDTIKAQRKAIGTSIIADRASWPKNCGHVSLFLDSCGLASLNGLRTSTDRKLSTKPEARTGLTIDTMIAVLVLVIPSSQQTEAIHKAASLKHFLRFLQSSLVFASIELHADCPL